MVSLPLRWPLSIAPMAEWTDRHFRYMLRQITRRTLLHTEMIVTGALLHGPAEALLAHDALEQPLAIQLGGDAPDELARCAALAERAGYCEVNLNAGCPSDRVQRGRFGACLMAEPARVAACVVAMRQATALPVTVKHRIGIDGLERYEDLARFVETVAAAGCARFIVHARIAVLTGLSPKQNRRIPPLRYDDVYRLKQEHPLLVVDLNGDVTDLDQAAAHLQRVDGVMIGRAAYGDPCLLADADRRFFGAPVRVVTRRQVLQAMVRYVEDQVAAGVRPHAVTRHLLGLLRGCDGGRRFRRTLSEEQRAGATDASGLRAAMAQVPDEVLDAAL
jgi:tRNA-dihydrouridine synthase A